MRIILDTGAMFRPLALARIEEEELVAVLPAVAYLERLRHYVRDGRPTTDLERILFDAGIEIEPFGVIHARRAAPIARDEQMWKRLARDIMIAAHVLPGDELWTTNPRDFLEIGVPAKQIVAL